MAHQNTRFHFARRFDHGCDERITEIAQRNSHKRDFCGQRRGQYKGFVYKVPDFKVNPKRITWSRMRSALVGLVLLSAD